MTEHGYIRMGVSNPPDAGDVGLRTAGIRRMPDEEVVRLAASANPSIRDAADDELRRRAKVRS